MDEKEGFETEAEQDAYRSQKAMELWPEEVGSIRPVVEEPVPPVDEPEEDEQQDPLSGVDPALRELIAGISGRLDKLDAIDRRLKPLEGRVGQLQQQMRDASEAVKKDADTPTKAQMAEASKDTEAMEILKEDFPEWFSAFESQKAELEELRTGLNVIRKAPDALGELKREYDGKLLAIKHPDWRDVVSSPAYVDWLGKQDQETQRMANESTDALECIDVLDRFHKEKPTKSAADIAQARAERLKAAESRPSGRNVGNTQKSEDDMTEAELRAHLAKKYWSN